VPYSEVGCVTLSGNRKNPELKNGALAERPYAEGFDILRIVGTYQTSGPGYIEY
jgi:hypothetical protein